MPDEMNKREVILTIREYENSVAMPEGERVTYLDPRGGVHLKDGDDKAPDYTGHAAKCAEYLRFGDDVDLASCGGMEPINQIKYTCSAHRGWFQPETDALYPTSPHGRTSPQERGELSLARS